MFRALQLLACSALLLAAGLVYSQVVAEIAIPPRPSPLRVLSPADHDLYARAFAAADRGNWADARTLAGGGQDPLTQRLLEWRYARDAQSGASFAEIDAVLKASPDFPGRAILYTRAEQAIAPDMDAAQLIAWFAGRSPSTGIGKIRLGDAYIAQGGAEVSRGEPLVRQGWVQSGFDAPTELAILARDGAQFTPEDDRARLDGLLWRGETAAARRELARVSGDASIVDTARLALAGGLDNARTALGAVADNDDPALLFDWSHALRLHGEDTAAHAMLLRISPGALIKSHAARWANECAIQARDALAAGDAKTAFALITHAGLSQGDAYADQQFLAGFIALRALKDPTSALPFFLRLDASVSRPISKARSQYWQARAYEALGNMANADAHYRIAMTYPETFYGQLALAHQTPSAPLHLNEANVEPTPQSEIDTDPLTPAIQRLAELGQRDDLNLFVDADIVAASPAHIRRLLQDMSDWGYPEIALRLAKTLDYAGLAVPEFAYPVVSLPPYPGSGPPLAPALVLSLIRQETEFDPYAVSSAGALGLMQVMPTTARASAKAAGLPYRPQAVLSDSSYNIQLGMVEFAGHRDRFDGSTILAIAAYNAGPANVRRWIATNGDPRLPGVDPVDWIEEIPFGETRNYVERVLENEGAYRDRLAGKDMPLMVLDDLYAPRAPPGGHSN